MSFSPSLKPQNGAVLLAVLIVTVILSLLVAGASAMLEKRLMLATKANDLLAQKMLAESIRSEMTYLLATQRITRAGVSQGTNPEGAINIDGLWASYFTGDELRVDGHKYQRTNEQGSIRFSIQAQNGLIPVNSSSQFWLTKWLISNGMDSFTAAKYTDSLADYADADDWSRPAGAESRSYRAQGLTEPSNFLLQHCAELNKVHQWKDSPELTKALIADCSLRRGGGINVNAIPESLLARLWPEHASTIMTDRERGEWFLSTEDAAMTINEIAVTQDSYVLLMPSTDFTLTLFINERAIAYDISLGMQQLPPFTVRPMQ